MVLVTDGRATTQWAKIRALGLEEYFDPQDIWVSEERGMGKLTFDPWKHAVDRYPEAKGFFALGDNPTKDFYNPNLLGFTTICLLDRGDNIHPQDTIPTPQHAASQLVGSLREAAEIILK